jgi:hypothetical protein
VPSFEASNRKLEDLGLGNSAEANSNRFHYLLISFNLSPEQNLRVKVYQRSEDINKMLGATRWEDVLPAPRFPAR